jgi:hypothetical protein
MIRKIINSKNYKYPSAILSKSDGNDLLYKRIIDGKPLMVSRFGLTELFACKNYLDIKKSSTGNILKQYFYRKRGYASIWKENVKKEINILSGVFPTTSTQLKDFSETYIKSASTADIMAIWNMSFEPFFINSYCKNAYLLNPESIEPYYHENPWSRALENKKVLVIHPFSESIKNQYNYRRFIFKNEKVLPNFELSTIKAVQSLADNQNEYHNWNDAFEGMCHLIKKTVFDIAIIGAGAYGLPLSAYIKGIGKIAIHLGGATQTLFGIKGKRWDEHPIISKMYNEHWVRPSEEEVPKNYKKTDSGCYW